MPHSSILHLVGHSTTPETSTSQKGSMILKFSIGQTVKVYNAEEQTAWYRITVFGKEAEYAAQRLQKGSAVYVVGRLEPREYTKKDGTKGFSLDVTATTVQVLDKRDSWNGAPPAYAQAQPEFDFNSIPF